MLCGGPVSCADAPSSPLEKAASQVVETMRGEVSLQQQKEQSEPTRGAAQHHLKEERYMGWCIYGLVHVLTYTVIRVKCFCRY